MSLEVLNPWAAWAAAIARAKKPEPKQTITPDEAFKRIREIHVGDGNGNWKIPSVCTECFRNWPCPTIKVLELSDG